MLYLLSRLLILQLLLLPSLHGLAPCAHHTAEMEAVQQDGASEPVAQHHHTGHHDCEHDDHGDNCSNGCSCHLGLTAATPPTDPHALLTSCATNTTPRLPAGFTALTRPPPRV